MANHEEETEEWSRNAGPKLKSTGQRQKFDRIPSKHRFEILDSIAYKPTSPKSKSEARRDYKRSSPESYTKEKGKKIDLVNTANLRLGTSLSSSGSYTSSIISGAKKSKSTKNLQFKSHLGVENSIWLPLFFSLEKKSI